MDAGVLRVAPSGVVVYRAEGWDGFRGGSNKKVEQYCKSRVKPRFPSFLDCVLKESVQDCEFIDLL